MVSDMTDKELFEHLCVNDPRSPYFDAEAAEGREPGIDCSCDDCFYGRHELVMALLSGTRTEAWVLQFDEIRSSAYYLLAPYAGGTYDIQEAHRFETKPESMVGTAIRVIVTTKVETVTDG